MMTLIERTVVIVPFGPLTYFSRGTMELGRGREFTETINRNKRRHTEKKRGFEQANQRVVERGQCGVQDDSRLVTAAENDRGSIEETVG